MITTILFIISSLLFISNFGIHILILNQERWEQPPYVDQPGLSLIPWISGYIFPAISISTAFEFNWIIVFLVNILVTKYLGRAITHGYLIRFANGNSLGKDLVNSFIAAIITLFIALTLKFII